MVESAVHPVHHAHRPVSLGERRGPITMGLLWITMATGFPTVLVGFEWFRLGITLPQVVVCSVVGIVVLLAYTIPTVNLAAATGKGYGLLNESVFGKGVSALINAVLILMFIGFYGLAALFMAEGINSLFGFTIPLAFLAAGLAILMALNNFFGFSGVANFARFFAAPVIIVWVGYTFFRIVPACPHAALAESVQHNFNFALTTISTFVIGYGIWGNESDYWKYAKPKTLHSAVPLAIAFAIGELLFPMTGWMVARVTHITDSTAATNFMSSYSFGGIAIFGAIVFFAAYFACNDSCLFGSSSALEVLTKWRHKTSVAVLALLGAACAYALAYFGAVKALELIVSINCVLLPTPSVIVLVESIIAKRFSNTGYCALPPYVSGTTALLAGWAVGVATSGAIPGTSLLQVGIPCLQGWIAAAALFAVLRIPEYKHVSSFARTVRPTELASQDLVAELIRVR